MKCPYCYEEIQKGSLKCRYCGTSQSIERTIISGKSQELQMLEAIQHQNIVRNEALLRIENLLEKLLRK